MLVNNVKQRRARSLKLLFIGSIVAVTLTATVLIVLDEKYSTGQRWRRLRGQRSGDLRWVRPSTSGAHQSGGWCVSVSDAKRPCSKARSIHFCFPRVVSRSLICRCKYGKLPCHNSLYGRPPLRAFVVYISPFEGTNRMILQTRKNPTEALARFFLSFERVRARWHI